MDDLKNIIESLLFVSKVPMNMDRFKTILEGTDTTEIKTALHQLRDEYQTKQGGFYLREVAGGYQFCTRPEYKDWIKRFIQTNPMRLSKAALEILAIIAWRQPVLRSDIEHIRGGVDCGGIIRMLLDRKLVRVMGRKDIPGRPLLYGTTRQFLELFDLKDIKDLPTPKEIEGIGETIQKLQQDESEAVTDTEPATREAIGDSVQEMQPDRLEASPLGDIGAIEARDAIPSDDSGSVDHDPNPLETPDDDSSDSIEDPSDSIKDE